jgi:hypothetical protein
MHVTSIEQNFVQEVINKYMALNHCPQEIRALREQDEY